MITPPPLKSGGVIGIVSPARGGSPEWVAAGQKFFEAHGYQTRIHQQNFLLDGQLAGSDAERAGAIMTMFTDPSIDAIFCARGGTGSLRIVDLLDYDIIRKNPKPFIGFSDITALLQSIMVRSKLIAYHGPMGWNFAQSNNDPRTGKDLLAILNAAPKNHTLHIPDVEVVRAGEAEGKLIGGNLSLQQFLIGTPYDAPSQNSILFIEDVDEVLYKIDEKLKQFKLAGKFNGIRAVIVGEMIAIADGETGFAHEGEKPYGQSLRDIILSHIPSDIPVCFNFPCGHGRYITTLPVGAETHLSLDKNGASLSFVL